MGKKSLEELQQGSPVDVFVESLIPNQKKNIYDGHVFSYVEIVKFHNNVMLANHSKWKSKNNNNFGRPKERVYRSLM